MHLKPVYFYSQCHPSAFNGKERTETGGSPGSRKVPLCIWHAGVVSGCSYPQPTASFRTVTGTALGPEGSMVAGECWLDLAVPSPLSPQERPSGHRQVLGERGRGRGEQSDLFCE